MDFQVDPGTFINDVVRLVDTLTADFIKTGFEAIANNWVASDFLSSVLTLYILYFLYQVKFYNTPIADATRHLVKVCFIFLISTNWSVFYILIYNVFTNEPLHILQVLLKGQGSSISDGSLNDTFVTGIVQAVSLLADMPFSFKGVLVSLLAAALLLIGTFLFTILALALIVISKFYLAVYLAIAPYFLMMFLFNGTKGLSESWVRACLNSALVPVFIGAVLLLTTTLAKACLGGRAGLAEAAEPPDFLGVVMYFVAGLLSAFLIKTIPEKAASLTSSLAIAGVDRMASFAGNLGAAGLQAGAQAKQGIHAAKNDFSKRQQQLHEQVKARADKRQEERDKQRERARRFHY